ncbi:tetratricopeptide repeat protein [Synechococcus lacustris]|uniref:tetratricopeptide repeat protein n=1 Tax=Synechococcus lacustris TaxID=2116544 RepID=UPI0020CE2D59|nr:hypothetical protein [Synechococcus lacustris]MCP9814490.1 hypothetical protein [Synechococcus lacustris L1E-Slac]
MANTSRKLLFKKYRQESDLDSALILAKNEFEANNLEPFWICWLGDTLRCKGLWAEAKNHWQKLPGVSSAMAPLWRDLGNEFLAHIYNNTGKAETQGITIYDAINFISCGCTFDPEAESLNNLAIALELAGDLKSASTVLELAIALKPNLNELEANQEILNLAIHCSQSPQLLSKTRLIDLGLNTASKLVQDQKNHSAGKELFEFFFKLLAEELNANSLALKITKILLELELTPFIYSCQEEEDIAKVKALTLAASLKELCENCDFENAANRKLCCRAAALCSGFYYAYLQDNDLKYFSNYSDALEIIFGSTPYKSHQTDKNKNEPIRLGIASMRLRNFNGVIGALTWLEKLPKKDYQIFVYMLDGGSMLDDDCSSRFQNLGICKYLSLNSENYQKVFKLIQLDALDVLLIPDVGMDGINRILSLQRLAPLQCLTWGHPVTSGSAHMDVYLSGDGMEPQDGQKNYREELVNLPGLGWNFEIPAAPKQDEYFNLAPYRNKNGLLLGSLQSLFKYLPSYDYVFIEILSNLANTSLCFISSGLEQQDQIMKNRILSKVGGQFSNGSTIHFLPRMSDASFISLFGQIDLNLDSLGWSGCNTSLRAMMMGCPTITYASELMRGRHTTAILKLLELSNCVAASPTEYINLCLELCNNPQQLLKIKRHILSKYTRLFNDDSCIEALDNVLKERIYRRKLNSIKN